MVLKINTAEVCMQILKNKRVTCTKFNLNNIHYQIQKIVSICGSEHAHFDS